MRRYLMSWMPREKRWKKMYRGVVYMRSCRQLGVAETREASWRAANAWWEGKRSELDSPDDRETILKAKILRALIEHGRPLDDQTNVMVDKLIGGDAGAALASKVESTRAKLKAPAMERAITLFASKWLELAESRCRAGQLSNSRFDIYKREVNRFSAWIGEHATVEAIDPSAIEDYFAHLAAKVASGEHAPNTAALAFVSMKQFVVWLSERGVIPQPGNLKSRAFTFNSGPKSIDVFTPEEIGELLRFSSERLRLYLLIMMNCGGYQSDVADMTQDEVDWKSGTIKRARSKTRDHGGLVVTYKLWPETFDLLKKHRAKDGPLALLHDGKPIARRWIEDGVMKKYDAVLLEWKKLARRMRPKKIRLSMMHLRKTSASMLGTHPQYKFYSSYFLAHAPGNITDSHYVIPSDAEFFEALTWLRGAILGHKRG